MDDERYHRLEEKLRELEFRERRRREVEEELLEKQALLKQQNINLVRKSIELSDVKRELEDRNFDLEAIQADLKETLSALTESEERYRHVVENSLAGIYVVQDLTVIFCNLKCAEIFGYDSPAEIVGRPAADMIAPESRELVARELNLRKAGEKETAQYEFKGLSKDGEIIDLEVLSRRVIFHGKPVVLGTLIDISRRKKLEEQLRQSHKMEAVGTLAGGIAHDFNNILNIIMGFTEMAIEDLPEDGMAGHNLEHVMISARRARELVKQILEFSRKSEEAQAPLDLGRLVKEVLKLLRASLPATVEILPNIRDGLKPVKASAVQMHQVIMNLCTNAAHAMGESGGILRVSLDMVELTPGNITDTQKLSPGGYIRLIVKDMGHGMEPEILERIFEPYFTTKERGAGTGMGLAVTYGIVNSHGGDITVYSEPGKGSEFYVYFPVIADAEEGETQAVDTLVQGGTERVLFVDDEEGMVDMTVRILQRLGYRATGETSSVAALKQFMDDPDAFDLVITDQTMPVLTGMQLADEIHRIRPQVPVILCSGFSENADETRMEEYKISGFLLKPFDKNQLAQTIRKVLAKQG